MMRMSRFTGLLVAVAGALACGCVMPVAAQAAFAIEPGSFAVSTSSDQAGAHADLTTSFTFQPNGGGSVEALLRNVQVELPVGFAGYPTAVQTCTPAQLALEACPMDSQIGTIEVAFTAAPGFSPITVAPVFNMAPPPGETAVFGFIAGKLIVANIVISVTPEYRIRATVTNVVSPFEITRQSLTLWGVPADPSHDAQRGREFVCNQRPGEERECRGGGHSAGQNPVPFLVNPGQCTAAPLAANLRVESWASAEPSMSEAKVGPFTGCERLGFDPSITVAPEQTQAISPTGYSVDVRVPQNPEPAEPATADLRDAVLRFPAGVVLSPSAADGLQACTEAQVGIGSEAPVACPVASKIAEATLTTPALSGQLTGGLYLGGPPSGPITGGPYDVYLVLAGHGVLVKIKGEVQADPVTGQLTTTFDENPELPFSDLHLQLLGGSRAPLANPASCGSFEVTSGLTPWSSPLAPDAAPLSAFEITGCVAPRFAPSFTAGTTSNQAGGYSPLSVTLSREDTDQGLAGITVKMPPGLVGTLAHVPLCGEPQAAQGTCGAESQIGELTAGAGPGPEPFFIKGGKVFLTGPYGGAPFGLSVVVPEKAGPFDLGSEVVRASVNVDPHTAQLTVSSQALPTIKDGIPFQVKTVNVTINRPEFTFNPTSCEPLSVTGELTSIEGTGAQMSSHFQATNCAALAFKPGFKVATSGRTSRAGGASLAVKLSFPSAPQGTQANIAKVKVDLPRQLPARLTTLQKACVAAQFEANPAGCPAASLIGHAKAITPILPVPLEGPAYFVSHGGEAFPSLIVVLQGYGVTVDLVGATFISKAGITSSTFKTVPDVPVGSFELTLPEGKYSALAANGNLCRSKLAMPTEFVAQNGMTIHQSTKISVTGCAKTKKTRQTKSRHRGASKPKRK